MRVHFKDGTSRLFSTAEHTEITVDFIKLKSGDGVIVATIPRENVQYIERDLETASYRR